MKKEGTSTDKLAKKKIDTATKVAILKEEIAKLNFSSAEFDRLEEQKVELTATVSELTERVDNLQAQLNGRLDFQYEDPVRGFDRSKVKGLVAKLINVKDPKYATALEVVAGGKLYQLVVDEAITGKALLDRVNLKKRVTIIPLDKIHPRYVGVNATQCAEKIAESFNATAVPAIELVGYDEEVRSAIEYVFANSIVVDSGKAASQIRDATKIRTVTHDGDVYDPSGTITGGSNDALGATLSRLTKFAEARKDLQAKKPLLDQLIKIIDSQKSVSSSYEKLQAKLELAETELEAASMHLSKTNYGMLVEKLESFKESLAEAEEKIVLMTKEKGEKWKLYEELKAQETELTSQREGRLSKIGQAVKDAKSKSVETAKLARETKSRSQKLLLELESLKTELGAAEEAVRVSQTVVHDASNEESETQMQVGDIQSLYEEARHDLETLEKSIAERSSEVVDMKRAKGELVKLAESAKLESKKLSVGIARIRKDRNDAEKVVDVMMKNYMWIESEMSAFGVRGGDYDFEATNPNEMSQTLKELKNDQENLVRAVMFVTH